KPPYLSSPVSLFWVLPLKTLEEVARPSDNCKTLYGHQMASGRLPSLLALEVESVDRTSADRQRDSGVNPPHLSRESALGFAPNSIGAAPPRIHCHGKDRGEISG